jgi:hypothetical protein
MVFYKRGQAFHDLYEKLDAIAEAIPEPSEIEEAMEAYPGEEAEKGRIVHWFDNYKDDKGRLPALGRLLEEQGFPDRILTLHKDPLLLLDCKDILGSLKYVMLLDEASDMKYVDGIQPVAF